MKSYNHLLGHNPSLGYYCKLLFTSPEDGYCGGSLP
jgi:hypothetical protein